MKKTLAIFTAACLLISLAWAQAPNYGTNLWLQISSVTNGSVSLILHNTVYTQTGEVYEVLSKTNRAIPGWNIETDVWAVANQNWTPFTVPMLGRTNLFIRVRDWTGVDENSNGIPDWWEYEHLGDVSSGVGSLNSSDATLKAMGDVLPTITQQPVNVTTNAGGNATFSVTASGTMPSYQWHFNSGVLANATNATLTLNNVQITNAGIYYVVVSNAVGSVTSSYAVLRVWAPSSVVAWGWNCFGQTNVPSVLTNAVAIAGGGNHSLALRNDGTVVAWGFNRYGQTNVPSVLTNAVAIAGGIFYSLALKSDGTVVAWGNNDYGQTNIPSGLTNVVVIAGGDYHSLALKSDGTVVAWGDNDQGQTNVPSGLTNVVAIAGGSIHSLALKRDGTVVAWGNNDYGQTNVPSGLTNVVAIAGGYCYSLALQGDGTVVAWGNNTFGQTNVPSGLTDVVAIAGGHFHSLALKDLPSLVITTQPQSQTVTMGSNATFSVTATGTLPLSYQWYFNETNVDGATNSSLALTNVQPANEGDYFVVVTNVAGSVTSSNAILTINVPPTITTQPTNQTIIKGSNAMFSVIAMGTAPLSYQWYFNATVLPDATNVTLMFTDVQTNNAGNYYVVVTNAAGSVTSVPPATLTVLVPPAITTQPTDQMAYVGDTVTLTVEAGGTQPLFYQWLFNGTNLPDATNTILTFNSVQTNNAGNYSVVVTNYCGSVTGAPAILTVEIPSMPSSLTNYTFQSATTYYINRPIQLYGVTTIEGGAVIKYAGQPAAQMTLNGPLACLSGPSDMALLTSKDDDSVGVTIEGSTGNPGNTNSGTYLSDESGQTNDYRFLRLAYAGTGISGSGTVNVRDCQFMQCRTAIDNGDGGTVTLMNNLFYYCSALANSATNLTSTLALSNNLVFGTTVNLSQPSNTVWYAFDNDFDSCTITNSTLTNGYNAYLNCNGRLYPTNVFDIVSTNSLAYQTSWLGSFYQPPDSPLIHAGSTTADQTGLYHYTVTTNQVVEGANTVSIGYHYVATDAYGNPLDTDGDGIPDYLEDANGNGVVDTGETSWTNYNSANGLTSTNGLVVFTPMK
jgi:alpha-tubulin suppressor-like RCC1 family protein